MSRGTLRSRRLKLALLATMAIGAVGGIAVPGVWANFTADAGNLHVRGFRGRGPKDHFKHLYLIGEVLRSWVVPRWNRSPAAVYTLAGEQL